MRIILYLIIIVGLFSFIACKATRDNKAYVRVISNPELADKTFNTLVKSRVVKVDTVITFVKGETVTNYDTLYEDGEIEYVHDTITGATVPCKPKIIKVTVTNNTTDSFIQTVPRAQYEKALEDEIIVLKTDKKNEIDKGLKYKKQRNTYLWIGIPLLLLCLFLAWLLFKTKSTPIKYG